MSRIDQQTGDRAGLLQSTEILLVRFVDTASRDNIPGGLTTRYPSPKQAESEIAVPYFINLLRQQEHLTNSPLTTQQRKIDYLSIITSQTVLVELSNQAHLQRYKDQEITPALQEQIDKASNVLGKDYIQQIIKGTAKPFIIIDQIN